MSLLHVLTTAAPTLALDHDCGGVVSTLEAQRRLPRVPTGELQAWLWAAGASEHAQLLVFDSYLGLSLLCSAAARTPRSTTSRRLEVLLLGNRGYAVVKIRRSGAEMLPPVSGQHAALPHAAHPCTLQTWCRGKKKWESETLCLDCHCFSFRSYCDPDFKTARLAGGRNGGSPGCSCSCSTAVCPLVGLQPGPLSLRRSLRSTRRSVGRRWCQARMRHTRWLPTERINVSAINAPVLLFC